MSRRARAIVGVIALYGLLLQAMLSGMVPAAAATDPGLYAICAPEHDPAPASDGDRKAPHSCCLPACAPAFVPAPSTAGAEPVWPPRIAARLAWSPTRHVPSTGPPVHAASPRGPPSP